MSLIQAIGIGIVLLVLVFNGVALARKWFKTKGPITYAVTISFLGFVVGIVLIFNERVTEMSLKIVGTGGTVKTALREARSDAEEIAQIKARVLAQTATIDAAFTTAAEARRLSEALSNNIVEAQTALRRFETNSLLLELVIASFADDRWAWDKLATIGSDTNHSFRIRALDAWHAVAELHNPAVPYEVIPSYPSRLNQTGLGSDKVALKELIPTLAVLNFVEKRGLMKFVFEDTRFKRREKLEFYLRIRELDGSLHVCEWAGRHFMAVAGIRGIQPLRSGVMNDWWLENEKGIKD